MRLSNSVYCLALVAHVPLLIGYVHINWNKGHYQFFPLLIAVVCWLLVERLVGFTKSNRDRPGSSKHGIWHNLLVAQHPTVDARATTASLVCLVLGGLVLGSAALVQSSFLVVPSLMLLLASWILGRFGLKGFMTTLPAWLLMLLAMPFPWNLDSILVNRMQFMASGLASWILDSLGQVHFRDGLTLVTAKKQFFTEEACSGIRSLFSSIAAISAFGVANRYPLWRHGFNWIQVVFWVLFGNAIRVAIVVYVSDNWTETIGSGAYHEFLGIGVFCLIIALALSTNRAIDAFGSRNDIQTDLEPASVIDGVVNSPEAIVEPALQRPGNIVNRVAMIYFALVLLFLVRLAYAQQTYRPVAFKKGDLIRLDSSALPEQINDWKVVSFDHKIRPETSLLAPSSFLWTLQKNNRTCVVSLDGPYRAFHDLSVCYHGLGWNLRSAYDTASPQGAESAPALSTLSMKKRSEHGAVMFAAFGRNGKQTLRSEAVSRTSSALKNTGLVLGLNQPENGIGQGVQQPVSQIQILHVNQREISDLEMDELKQLYYQVCKSLLATERFVLAPE